MDQCNSNKFYEYVDIFGYNIYRQLGDIIHLLPRPTASHGDEVGSNSTQSRIAWQHVLSLALSTMDLSPLPVRVSLVF